MLQSDAFLMPLETKFMLRDMDDLTQGRKDHAHARAAQKPAATAKISHGTCEETAPLVPVAIDPPVTVPETPAILAPPDCETDAWMALVTDVASGTLAVPVPISKTWLVVELKSV